MMVSSCPRGAAAVASSHGRPALVLAFAVLASALMLTALFGVRAAFAAVPDPAGRVTIVLGSVEAVAPDGSVRTLARQDPVFEGDTLRSGPRGRAQIRFTDRSLLSLRPDTELSIDDYEYDDAAPSAGRQSLNLASGGFRKLTGKVADGNRSAYRVSTPLAVIGVRGTIYDAFYSRGGPLVLGVARGAIRAESNSGRVAELGVGSGFNYARFNADGSIEFLIEPPAELASSPELDEGGEGGEGGGGGGGAPDDSEGSSVATGGGDAESTAGTVQAEGTQPVQTVSNPDSGTIINEASTGSGEVPTTTPIPTSGVLTAAEREAFLASNGAIVGAGVTSIDVGPDGLPLDETVGTGSGFGAFTAGGLPVIVVAPDVNFPEGITSLSRSDALANADQIFTARSGTYQTLLTDVGGVVGLDWGQVSAPIVSFLDVDDPTLIEESFDDVALFALGQPRDIADLTGTALFQSVQTEVRTSGLAVEDLFSEVFVDFGAGSLDGIIDILLSDPTDSAGQAYAYIVDFVGRFEGGYLVDTAITTADFSNLTTRDVFAVNGDIAGFLTGADGDALQLSFGFSTPGNTDADLAGLILLRSGLATPALFPNERTALATASTVAVGAGVTTLVEDPNGGIIEDPAGAGSAIATLFNDTDPLIAAFPGTHFPVGFASLSRDASIDQADGLFTPRSGAFSIFLRDAGGVAGLDWLEFTAPIDLFLDPNDATLVEDSFDDFVLLAVGAPRDIADLTGTAFFESVLFDVRTSGATADDVFAELSLNFDTGGLDGILDVLLSDPQAPASPSGAYIVDFIGQLESGVVTSTTITDGFYIDLGTGTQVAVSGDIAGFLTGSAGDALQLSFGYFNGLDATTNVAGLVLLRSGVAPSQRLLPDEFVELRTNAFGYVQATCCFAGPGGGVFKGRMNDPLESLGQDVVFTRGPASALDPAFNDLVPGNVILRPSDGVAQFFASTNLGAGAELSWFELQGFADGGSPNAGPIRTFDANTGAVVNEITNELLTLSGRPADIASLTGTARFELVQLAQGFASTQGGGFASLVEPGLNSDGSLAFNVDFATGDVFDGFLRLFTDPQDIGLPPVARDRVDAGFDGVVGVSNGNPFMDLGFVGGIYLDSDGNLGGDGLVDTTQSGITGMFAGDGSVANVAFSIVTMDDPLVAGTPDSTFLEATNLAGTAILAQANLALTAAEQAELQAGRVFVGVECCAIDSGIGIGPAGDPRRIGGDLLATDGDFVLAINQNGAGDDLLSGEAGVLDPNSAEIVLRSGDSFSFVDPSFTAAAPASADVVAGGWSAGFAGNTALVGDAVTGDLLGNLGETVFFMTGIPGDIASLQSVGFTTFAGSTDAFAQGIQTLGGFADTSLPESPDPDLIRSFGSTVSFNVDLATGEVLNGHVFGRSDVDLVTGEEFGFELFFDGQLQYANGNTFIDATLRDGVLDETVALDLAASELSLFIAGDPAAQQGLIALGALNVKSVDGVVSVGTFSVGNSLLPETRLNLADAQALNSGRLGLAAYRSDPFFSPDAFGAGGLLLGRGSATVNGDDFLLGANSLFLDPDSGLEVNTARMGFFEQPYDFVLTRDTGVTTLFSADVVPTGGASLAGFEISWGIWDGVDFSTGALIQDDAADPGLSVVIDRDVFFASVNPTPQSQLPVTGIFTYATSPMAVAQTDFVGSGSGDLSFSTGADLPLTSLAASFELDFATGNIANGTFQTTYDAGSPGSFIEWNASFDGFVNGAVTDLTVQSLAADSVSGGSVLSTFVGNPLDSRLSGVLTGPAGERFVGGFSFYAEDFQFMGSESVQGVFVMDQVGGGL